MNGCGETDLGAVETGRDLGVSLSGPGWVSASAQARRASASRWYRRHRTSMPGRWCWVLVDDTIGSLASLVLAADIVVAQQGRLHVAHVSPPPAWTGMACLAAMPVPAILLAEADHAAAGRRLTETAMTSAQHRLNCPGENE